MKDNNPASGGGRQGGRKPQQNQPKGSGPRSARPGSGGKAPAQGRGGFTSGKAPAQGRGGFSRDKSPQQGRGGSFAPAKGQPAWKKEGSAAPGRGPGAKPFTPRKDTGRSGAASERRYGRPGSKETYQPQQGRGRSEPGFTSPAARRFGPGSKQTYYPFRPQQTPPPVQEPQRPANDDRIFSEEEAIAAGINLLTGRNPIREALKTGRDLEKLMVAKGDLAGSARQIVSMAKDAGVKVQFVERARLDQITKNHQGMVAYASAYQYAALEDIFQAAADKGEAPFIVILDQVTDPHNLGAVIRTAVCAGAHGVIVPLHRAVGLTPAAVKASVGGVEHIKVVRVGNLNQTIKLLKDRGIWLYAADQEGEDYRSRSITGPCALVIGSEGEGISPLTRSLCDHRLKIPMSGSIGSLNASVAAGILMYAVFSGRNPL